MSSTFTTFFILLSSATLLVHRVNPKKWPPLPYTKAGSGIWLDGMCMHAARRRVAVDNASNNGVKWPCAVAKNPCTEVRLGHTCMHM